VQDSLVKMMTSNPRGARWGTRTAAPVDSIVAGEAIFVLVVIVVIAVISLTTMGAYMRPTI
jgi:hypothetical protein